MLKLDRLETLKAALEISLLFLCEDILVVKLIFTGVNILGGKYLWVVFLGVLLLGVFFRGQLSRRNFPFNLSLQIQH